jgi:hypothetical protein
MSEGMQRPVSHVADAFIACQRKGAFAPRPLELGSTIGGHNSSAVDWVGAIFALY